MKITRRQLRKIISEALGDRGDLPRKYQYKIGMRGPEDLPMKKSPAPDARTDREFDKAFKKMTAFGADPKDMADMEEIRNTYYFDYPQGEASMYLKRLVAGVDTIIREQIPQDVYYWIFPELLESTRRRRVISEAAFDDASSGDKAAAMLGFIQEYTVDNSVDAETRMGRVMQMADLIEILVDARDGDKEPNVSGKNAQYAERIKKALTEDESAEDFDDYVEKGKKVKLA